MNYRLLLTLFLLSAFARSIAQTCDPNIDFETGTPANWQYYKGTIYSGPVYSLTPTPHDPVVHTIMSGTTTDPFGGFPVVGQGSYSLRLGHDSDNRSYLAMAASCYLHIPAGGSYSVVYHYASVMQEPGSSHSLGELPRFEVSAIDSATGIVVPLSTTSLEPRSAGFIRSSHSIAWGDVYYKPWSTGIIDLAGYSGRTVMVRFIGAGCSEGAHFGYSYIDMNCLFLDDIKPRCTDASVTLTAPGGYAAYHWVDAATYATSYSATTTATVAVTARTTKYAVILTPFTGHGTTDTLYTTVHAPLETHKTRDTSICLGESIELTTGTIDVSTLTYSWTPSTGLSCTTCDTVTATPPLGLNTYYATVSDALGCTETDTINITVTPALAGITGTTNVCTGSTTTLSDATTGGTWSSATSTVAMVGSASGVVSGISGGTTTITYTYGCAVTTTINVIETPTPVLGPDTICERSYIYLYDGVAGGTWSSSNTSVATVLGSGIVSGIAAGTANITYTTGSMCSSATKNVTVLPSPAAIPPCLTFPCAGSTVTLSDAVPGGVWSSGDVTIATVGSTSGVVTELGTSGAGVSIYYTIASGCSESTRIYGTVSPTPITGGGPICVGSTTTLLSSGPGPWSSASTAIVSIGSISGVVSGVAAGTTTITYGFSGCYVTTTVTVAPTVMSMTASGYTSCGSTDTMSASGAYTYIWSPSAGLSCSTCATVTLTPTVSATYTVTGTNPLGCTVSKIISVMGDRIFGHITFSSSVPDTLDMKVWLITYNPADSSVTAVDSVLTCTIDSVGYYEFDSKPTGTYFVKAMLLHGNPPGGGGYIPSYGSSSGYWFGASGITHTSGLSDSMHITMVYGTVPPGPGFISGNVYSGAGKGTSGETLYPGMLMYLKDAVSGTILAHTYTDGLGAYTFSGVANGSYIVYPEEYQYRTTPSPVISLSVSNETITAVNFKRHTSPKLTITPFNVPEKIEFKEGEISFSIFPVPSKDILTIRWSGSFTGDLNVVVTDMAGRQINAPALLDNRANEKQIDIKGLTNGLYIIALKGDGFSHSGKLIVDR